MNRAENYDSLHLLFVGGKNFDPGPAMSILNRELISPAIEIVHNEVELAGALITFKPDILVINLDQGSFPAEQVLRITREHAPAIPIVVVATEEKEPTAIECLKAGAHSYVLQSQLVHLPFAIREAIRWGQSEKTQLTSRRWLLDSQTNLTAFLNNTDDIILATDTNSRLTAFNHAFEKWCMVERGLKPISGRLIYDFLTTATTHQLRPILDRSLQGEKIHVQHTYATGDQLLYFETHFYPIYHEGNLVGTTSRSHNITNQVTTMMQFEKTQQELRLKNRIDQCFLTMPDDQIHKEVLKIIAHEFQSALSLLGFVEKPGGNLVVDTIHIGTMLKPGSFGPAWTFPAEACSGIWEKALKSGSSVVHEGGLPTPGETALFERVLLSPLLYKGELIGLLHLADKPDPFTDADSNLLQSVAAHLAPIFTARRDRQLEESQRIQAERARRESERRLELLMNNLPGMAYRCYNDPDWTMEFVSAGCYPLTGYQPEELLGNRRVAFNDLILEEYRQYLWEKWQHVLCRHAVFQDVYRIRTATGELKWVWEQGQGVFDHHGDLMVIEGFIVDITEQREAQNLLHASEKKYRQLFESMAQGVVYHNRAGEIVAANPAAERILGLSADQLNGRVSGDHRWQSVHDDGTPFPADEHPAALALRTGLPVENVTMGIVNAQNGKRVWININAIPLFTEGDPLPVSVFATFDDITARVDVAHELRLTRDEARRANELKDSFIANISHEIRTPLNALLGFSDLLQDRMAETEKTGVERFVEAIHQAGTRLMRSMDLILNYSRTQTGNYPLMPVELDILELIQRQAADFKEVAKIRNLRFIVESRCENTIIRADEYSLRIVFDNLIDNALKYTPQGEVSIVTFCSGDHLHVEIADTGIGMTPDFIQTLFTPYSQEHTGPNRPYEGLGLGLSLTRRLLEYNDATISVDSVKNVGTKFLITFKQTKPSKNMQPPIEKNTNPASNSLPVILVVEDDASSQYYMEVILQRAFQPVIVSNDRDAFRILESKKVAMILMDISLKDGVDGLEITRMVRNDHRFANIPVVAVTAHAFPADKQRSIEAGCNDYLSKPVKKDDLLRLINQYITD